MMFSIVIPVYNIAPCLRECLDSLRGQSFADWEAICVDDGSTDESGIILDEYSAKDSRFVVLHKKNAGVSSARNDGLDTAKGEYIGFLDGDDKILPNWLQIANDKLLETHVDLLQMSLAYWTGNDQKSLVRTRHIDVIRDRRSLLSWGWREYLENGYSYLNFYRNGHEKLLRFPVGLPMREDNIFTLNLLRYCQSAAQVDHPGYLYRMRPGSAVTRVHSWHDQCLFRKALKRVWKELQPEMRECADYDELRLLYREHLHRRLCGDLNYYVRLYGHKILKGLKLK